MAHLDTFVFNWFIYVFTWYSHSYIKKIHIFYVIYMLVFRFSSNCAMLWRATVCKFGLRQSRSRLFSRLLLRSRSRSYGPCGGTMDHSFTLCTEVRVTCVKINKSKHLLKSQFKCLGHFQALINKLNIAMGISVNNCSGENSF